MRARRSKKLGMNYHKTNKGQIYESSSDIWDGIKFANILVWTEGISIATTDSWKGAYGVHIMDSLSRYKKGMFFFKWKNGIFRERFVKKKRKNLTLVLVGRCKPNVEKRKNVSWSQSLSNQNRAQGTKPGTADWDNLSKKMVLQTITQFTIEFTETMNMTTLQHLVKNSPENKFYQGWRSSCW